MPIRRPNLMATTMATPRAKQWQWLWRWQSAGQQGWEKNDRGNSSGNRCGKKMLANTRQRQKHGRQIQWQNLGCGLELLATHVATKGQSCNTSKNDSKTGDKAMAKIVARAKDRTHKWEITGKSRPRRHIAWPRSIVCSRWLAHAASEIAPNAKQVAIFNQMIVP